MRKLKSLCFVLIAALSGLPVISAVSTAPNICPDGEFSSGKVITVKRDYSEAGDNLSRKWHLILSKGADADPAIADGGCRISVKKAGTKQEDIRLCMQPLDIYGGSSYRLSFSAKTAASRTIGICFDKPGATPLLYGKGTVNLTPGTERYTFEFQMNEHCTHLARVWFGLGDNTGEVWIGDVSIEML